MKSNGNVKQQQDLPQQWKHVENEVLVRKWGKQNHSQISFSTDKSQKWQLSRTDTIGVYAHTFEYIHTLDAKISVHAPV